MAVLAGLGMHRPTRLLLGVLLGLICSLGPGVPSAAKAQPPAVLEEYEAKAAFLFNFAKFVHWPQPTRPEEPLRIGIVGANPFGATIHHLEESSIGGRPVRVLFPENRDGLRACQVLFIGRSETHRLPRWLADLETSPVLTVSDMDDFAARGGMIGLLLHNNRIRFEINLAAAQQAGLSFSSKLLSLAINAEELGRERQP